MIIDVFLIYNSENEKQKFQEYIKDKDIVCHYVEAKSDKGIYISKEWSIDITPYLLIFCEGYHEIIFNKDIDKLISIFNKNFNNMIDVNVINKSKNELPKYSSLQSSGCDAHANLENINKNFLVDAVYFPEERKVSINPKGRALIPTGLFVEIPKGYEIQVRSRSGLALKQGIMVLNSPGTIDSDYRGEIGVILYNAGNKPVTIKDNDRICQFVLCKVEQISWNTVKELNTNNDRGGGFGHSGK